jgi:hypothetical protein
LFPVILLTLWATLFILGITPAAKKFDRYILPAVPALLILGAVAWAAWTGRKQQAGRWLLALAITAQALYCLVYAAYPLTAYNPLVGGPRTAVAVLPVGWGEGIGAAGRSLASTQPGAEAERAIAGVAQSLAPFFPGRTLVDGIDDPATADYTIVTLGGRQLDPSGVAEQTGGLELVLTERFGGLDQAWVYRRVSPRPPAAPAAVVEPAFFGDRMALSAYEQVVDDDWVSIAARWRRLAPLSAGEHFTLRIVIRDGTGNVWATWESKLLNEVSFFPPDWAADETETVRYLLELPPGIPPSTYRVDLSLIDDRTVGQLPVHAGEGGFQGVAFTAGEIAAPPPESVVLASRLQIPTFTEVTWLDGRLRLLGYGEIPVEALAGGELPVDLFWHAPIGSLPPALQLAWRLRPSDEEEQKAAQTEPLSRYDTGLWRVGETIQEKYRVPLPPDLPAGRYELTVAPLTSDGEPAGPPQSLGEIQINNIDRVYEADVPIPFMVDFGAMDLLGMNVAELSARPGESPELTLYWEKGAPHGEVYTVFVHVLDEAGNIVQYADHWPGGLPTDILDGGQIIIDRFALMLPSDLPQGDYRIRAGLYSAESGQRLPAAVTGRGELDGVASDSVILPIVLRVVAP